MADSVAILFLRTVFDVVLEVLLQMRFQTQLALDRNCVVDEFLVLFESPHFVLEAALLALHLAILNGQV